MLSPVQFELEFPVEVEMLNGGEEQVKNVLGPLFALNPRPEPVQSERMYTS